MTLAAVLTVTGACATNTAVPETPKGPPAMCSRVGPITWSEKDTPETKRQIWRWNSVYECLCNKDCP